MYQILNLFYQRRLSWTFLELSEQNRKQRNLRFSFAISFLQSFDQVTQDLHMLHSTWIIRIVFVINVKLKCNCQVLLQGQYQYFPGLDSSSKTKQTLHYVSPVCCLTRWPPLIFPPPHQCRHASNVQSNVNLKPLVNCHNIITITEINYQIHHFHYR